jgi:hypothetical protein
MPGVQNYCTRINLYSRQSEKKKNAAALPAYAAHLLIKHPFPANPYSIQRQIRQFRSIINSIPNQIRKGWGRGMAGSGCSSAIYQGVVWIFRTVWGLTGDPL